MFYDYEWTHEHKKSIDKYKEYFLYSHYLSEYLETKICISDF